MPSKPLWLKVLLVGVLLGATLFGIFRLYVRGVGLQFDEVTLRAFENAKISSIYRENNETIAQFPDRRLQIEGTYLLDLGGQSFASVATTTLHAINGSNISVLGSFTIENVSIADDVFFKTETESPHLSYILSPGRGWHHYVTSRIPPSVVDIAVHGPIQDDLAIFRDGIVYLRPESGGARENELTHYRMIPSGISTDTPGPLHDLLARLGSSGHVDVWIDAKDSQIRRVHFSGENYESTSTFQYLPSAVIIPPIPLTPLSDKLMGHEEIKSAQ